ncbi:hypothetical protein EW026_g8050 [Hermanssonia centrifuga]|uniref:Uncharacterized protein n=1 Tax=Hermanssonia centrifuga TaxID=98765 RepID=A0A4S4K5R0_9APHY|nr:hypothetical protein EW026_g8050 [Hermanssonia centrifuga]
MDDCDGLVQDILDYMKTIVDAFQGKNIACLDQTFDGIIDAFQQELQKILGFVEKLSSHGTFKQVVMHAHDKCKISGFKDQLQHVFHNVDVTQAIGPTLYEPSHHHGRDDVIHNAIAIITSEQNTQHIAVLGQGGIGKTSVALSVLHDTKVKDYFKDNSLAGS